MADIAARARQRGAARETPSAKGDVYPAESTSRPRSPRGPSPSPVRGAASQPGGALPRSAAPGPGLASEPPAAVPSPYSSVYGAAAALAGGAA